MIVERLILGDFETNSYIVRNESAKSVLLIDAPEPAEPIIERFKELTLTPEFLVITHAHVDHIAGIPDLRTAFPNMKLAASGEAGRIFRRPTMNLSLFMARPTKYPPPDIELSDGEVLSTGGLDLTVILLEGHARGSICLLSNTEPAMIFSGDTLFAGSIGRADLPGGNMQELTSGIHTRIMSLPDETIVYPGHGLQTTVGVERNNPYLL